MVVGNGYRIVGFKRFDVRHHSDSNGGPPTQLTYRHISPGLRCSGLPPVTESAQFHPENFTGEHAAGVGSSRTSPIRSAGKTLTDQRRSGPSVMA